MRILLITFLFSTIFISCIDENKNVIKKKTQTSILSLKELDLKTDFEKGLQLYAYDKSLYQNEKLPIGIYDTKIGISDSIIMTLNYGVTRKAGFGASTATLKLIHKGVPIIDSSDGNIQSMEKWYFDLLKKKHLKNSNLFDFINYESDTINLLKSNCDTTSIKHYPTYKGDNIIRRQTKDKSLFQYYYSGTENRVKICLNGKNYDIKINDTDSIKRYSPTIALKDITGDSKEELFFVERIRPDYWAFDGFYIDIYEVTYPNESKI